MSGAVTVQAPARAALLTCACVSTRCRVGSGREQHVRDPIELDLDCGLLIFEDGEWRLRKSSDAAGTPSVQLRHPY